MRSGRLTNSTLGEYRLTDFLGAGGMGEVYRAVQPRLGRVVAIKILNGGGLDSNLLRRFENEASIQARLHHAGIATLYDFIEPGGQPCIVMEYVDGLTLDERVKSLGPFSVPEAVTVFQGVVSAVNYIHANGIVHRDIKSNNIKISSTGEVKLLDFGIAKSESSPKLTHTGNVIGTLQYLSPEQLKGASVDSRSDIWALGVLLYEMISGKVPFEAETVGQLLEKIGKAAYVAPSALNPSVPRELENVINNCLKKNPAARYQSTRDLLYDLQQITLGVGVQDKVVIHSTNRSFFISRWPILSVALVLFVLLGFVFYLVSSGPDEPTATTTAGSAPKVKQPAKSANTVNFASDPGAEMKTVSVNTLEGAADVYDENGRYLGPTPYIVTEPQGKRVVLILKRPGYEDNKLIFNSGERKDWTITMKKLE